VFLRTRGAPEHAEEAPGVPAMAEGD
jgi:hypothetical protein